MLVDGEVDCEEDFTDVVVDVAAYAEAAHHESDVDEEALLSWQLWKHLDRPELDLFPELR